MPEPVALDQRRDHSERLSDAAPVGGRSLSSAVELSVFDNLDDVELEWRAFEAAADCTPFQTFDWLSAWCRHIGSRIHARPVIVIGRREGREPLFILPLVIVPGAAVRLRWLGFDLSDYNAPLLAPDFSRVVSPERFAELWRDVRRLLQQAPQHRHDLIELIKMPETVGSQTNPFLALPTGFHPSNAYAATLSDSWDKFYEARRSSATRRRDRTKLKRLAEFGAIHFVTPQERFEIQCTVEILAEQKARSFVRMGVPNIFARPGWMDFYLDIATSPRMRSLVHVSRLDVGSHWSAINLGLVFRDCYYHVLASHDDGAVSRFGPGVAHLRDLLRFAIERGLRRFDFTIGDERYKLEWSDRTMRLYDHIAVAGMRGWPIAFLARSNRRLRRVIKQNDMLWSLVSRVRSMVGARGATAANNESAPKIRDDKSPPIAPA